MYNPNGLFGGGIQSPFMRRPMGLLGQDFSAGQGVGGSQAGYGFRPPTPGIGGRPGDPGSYQGTQGGGFFQPRNAIDPAPPTPTPPGLPGPGTPIANGPGAPGVAPPGGNPLGGQMWDAKYGAKPTTPMQQGQTDWVIDPSGNWTSQFSPDALQYITSMLYGNGQYLNQNGMDKNNMLGWIQGQTGVPYQSGPFGPFGGGNSGPKNPITGG